MRNKLSKYASVFFVALLFSMSYAQTNGGTFEGTVVDPTGAVVPNAVIKAALIDRKNNNWQKIIITDSEGKFRIENLPLGIYELEITSDMFPNKLTKQIEVKSDKPLQTNVTFTLSLEACSEEDSKTISNFATNKDKSEIVRQMLKTFLEKHSNLFMDEQKDNKIILSTENIKKEWLTTKEKQELNLMEQSEIQRLADNTGDFLYLKFSELKVKGKCVSVSLDNIWAIGKNSGKGYLSGGGVTYEFRKIDNRWVKKYVTGWIS